VRTAAPIATLARSCVLRARIDLVMNVLKLIAENIK
jgi:hypothetical protein